VRVLHERKVPLRRDVILAWTGDEERGGGGLAWLLEHARDAVGDAGLAFNEGGGVELDAGGRAMSCSIHVAEKIYVDFEIHARGKSGHSSRPVADNAIYRLSRALTRLGAHRFPPRFFPVTRGYFLATAGAEQPALRDAMTALARAEGPLPRGPLEVLDGNPRLASLLRTTCVATQLAAGSGPNVLAADATANVNCRILPDESAEDVRRKLVEIVEDPAIEIVAKPGFGGRSPQSPLAGEGPDAITRVIRRRFPDVPVIPYMSSFVTDSRQLRAAGIPTYGFDGIAITDEEGSRVHGADERMPTRALGPALETMYELVVELAAR
jgi:acetylornithine deacetylase/succinyl-diaminopimelate desuccinylase-like protein